MDEQKLKHFLDFFSYKKFSEACPYIYRTPKKEKVIKKKKTLMYFKYMDHV